MELTDPACASSAESYLRAFADEETIASKRTQIGDIERNKYPPESLGVDVFDSRFYGIEKRAYNVTSQFGEDGLIEAIFDRIGVKHKTCFEVGATDGEFFSNTRALRDKGWSAVLVESNPVDYAGLAKLASETVITKQARIGPDCTIDECMGSHFKAYDLGVIDIDGGDLDAWRAMRMRPRVMVMECREGGGGAGASRTSSPCESVVAVGEELGYTAICRTYCNILFVANEELTGFEKTPIRLNIGAGDTVIDGFTPIDRKLGTEAYPLEYPDDSVDEIRASHILEHFPLRKVPVVLKDWVRALKPGGTIRISVPDFDKITQLRRTDEKWSQYLCGGQLDENDFHQSVFDSQSLVSLMGECGLTNIHPWESHNTDLACHPVSLNMEGYKAVGEPETIKIAAVMSIPRVGWNDAWGCAFNSLLPFKIPIRRFNGAFWGQCMQRAIDGCVADGLDWVLTIDYDTMFTSKDLDTLIKWLGTRPDIDAIASFQARRGGHDFPLMGVKGKTTAEWTGEPLPVDTAHFGLTLIRLDALKDIPKPWFASTPGPDGGWDEGRVDDDIYFWNKWKEHGKTVYVAPDCRVGHLQLMVSEFDENLECRHIHVTDWWDRVKNARKGN